MESTIDVLSWTNQDPRDGRLFNAWGVLYRFSTALNNIGVYTTCLWRSVGAGREECIAKLEWTSNGSLGRATINGNTIPISDLVRPDSWSPIFTGPDGSSYHWRPAFPGSPEVLLEDHTGNVVAFFRPMRAARYQIGDVYGELHFLRNAGAGTITHLPMMTMVIVTAMLYRFNQAFGL